MARTSRAIGLAPDRTDARPTPIPLNEPGWSAEIPLVVVTQLDADTVILLPQEYIYEDDFTEDVHFRDSMDARWREQGTGGCMKTTVVYEQIGEGHAHLVPFIRRDPWNACPVLARPSGPPMDRFMHEAREVMYSAPLDALTSRVLPSHRPLMYQWALHLISGLSFVHSKDVVFGQLSLSHCWLSADAHLSLSLVGFLNAGFWNTTWGRRWHDGDFSNAGCFRPQINQDKPTMQTDLFFYGCLVYELMTGALPGDRLGIPRAEIENMVACKRWPVLETEYMGEIVHKCWAGGFENAEQVKAKVVAFLEGLGWEIEGNDDLKGFDVADLEF